MDTFNESFTQDNSECTVGVERCVDGNTRINENCINKHWQN